MKLKIASIAIGCLMGSLSVQAANISGSVQASYNYNLTIANDSTNVSNSGHSYDPQSGTFSLNNAHLAFTGADSASGLGYAVELDAGFDAAANSIFSTGFPYLIDVQEAYLTKSFSSGLGMKAGKYATYQGIEVVEGGANPTITRGFLFGMAEPVTHTGLEFSFSSGMFDGHLGAINGWDVLLDNNSMPSWVAKTGFNFGDPLMLAVSGIIGPEAAGNNDDMRMSFDVTGVSKSIPMVDLWFQGNYGMEPAASAGTPEDAAWFGFGIQPLVHLSDLLGLGLRYEFFSDGQGNRSALFPGEVTLQNITLTPTFWLGQGLMVRAEFRMDMASEDVYLDADGAPTGSQMQIAADVVASF